LDQISHEEQDTETHTGGTHKRFRILHITGWLAQSAGIEKTTEKDSGGDTSARGTGPTTGKSQQDTPRRGQRLEIPVKSVWFDQRLGPITN